MGREGWTGDGKGFTRQKVYMPSFHHKHFFMILVFSAPSLLCRHYVVVKYKDKPLEFWDLKSRMFLREMVSNPPSFSCIEWTPTPHRSKSKVEQTPSSTTVDFDLAMGGDSKMMQALSKEYLTVMDAYGSQWQITIEGSKVKVINSTPTQVSGT